MTESWDIARYADREGDGEKLIPVAQEAEVQAWTDLADEGMQAGRALVVAGIILRTPAALEEQIPPAMPRWVRSAMRPVSRALTKAFARKYALPFDALESEERTVRSVLARRRAGLSAWRDALYSRQAPGPRARVTPGAGARRGAESEAMGARRTCPTATSRHFDGARSGGNPSP
ncbi:MAG: hypothetical protein WBY94_30660 [Polyangiaceae bacterium]